MEQAAQAQLPAKPPDENSQQLTQRGQLFTGLSSTPRSLTIPTPFRETKPQHSLARELFNTAYKESTLTFDDLLPFRIAVTQRLVREMARHRSLIALDEPLADRICESFDDDISTVPRPLIKPDMYGQFSRPLSLKVFAAMKKAEQLPPEWHVEHMHPDTLAPTASAGVPLLPPPIPSRFLTPHGISPDYDPFEDEALLAYIDVLAATAEFLQIESPPHSPPTPEAASAGRWGMVGLLAPDVIRHVFPSRFQIIAAEQYHIEHVLELLTDHGPIKARKELDRSYGLHRHEIESLCRMAMKYARAITEMDLDDHKAMMMARLDGFIARAREALDLRAELMAVKTMSIVLGLAKTEGEDGMKDIVATVRKVSNDRESMRLLPPAK